MTHNSGREKEFLYLQEIFSNRIDRDVIYLILTECNYKVDEATKKLSALCDDIPNSAPAQKSPSINNNIAFTDQNMAARSPYDPLQPTKLQYMPPSPGTPPNMMNAKSPAIPTPASRIPIVQRSQSQSGDLPMQSPRTPNLSHMHFADFGNVTEENTDLALKAIDLYANTIMTKNLDSPPDLFNSFPSSLMGQRNFNEVEHQPSNYEGHTYQQFDPNSMGVGTPTTAANVTSPINTSANRASANMLTNFTPNNSQIYANNNGVYMQGDKRTQGGGESRMGKVHNRKQLPMKALRKYHISLDPKERESLEQLVEEVILDGVGVGVIDSDSTSTDDSTEDMHYPSDIAEMLSEYSVPENQMIQLDEDGIPGMPGITQSQLKVAAKHMKNLPPRFQRRLKVNGEEDTGEISLDGTLIGKSSTEKSKGARRNRYLLEGMDVYADENAEQDISANSLDGQTTPNSVTVSSPCVSSPDSVRLERTDPGLRPVKQPDMTAGKVRMYPGQNVMRCDDLEKELMNPTSPEVMQVLHQRQQSPGVNPSMLPPMSQRPPGYFGEPDKKPGFSIDAPEFVPRTTNSPGQPVTSIATTHPYPVSKADMMTLNASRMAAVRSSSPFVQGHPVGRLSPQVAAQIAVVQGRSSPVPPSFLLPPRNSPVPQMAEQRSSPSLAQQQAYMLQKMHAAAAAGAPKIPVPIAYTSPYAKLHHPYAINAANAAAAMHYRQLGFARGIHPSGLPYVTAPHPWPLGRTGSPAKLNLLPQHQHPYLPVERPTTDQQCKDLVKAAVDANKKIMIILRGYPGSGKSVLAKILKLDGVILSADDFFITDGQYKFDFGKLGEAHDWNQKRASQAAMEGKNPIIIDNTNSQMWEMKVYAKQAFKNGYIVEVFEPNTKWKVNVKELAKRNVHNITEAQILKMKDRYENNITGWTLLAKYGPDQAFPNEDGELGGKKTVKKRRRRRKRGRGRNKKNAADKEDESASDEESGAEKEPSDNVDPTSTENEEVRPRDSGKQSNDILLNDEDSDNAEVAQITQGVFDDDPLDYPHHHHSASFSHHRQVDVNDEVKEMSKTFLRSMSLPGNDNPTEVAYWKSAHDTDNHDIPVSPHHPTPLTPRSSISGSRLRSQMSWTADPMGEFSGKPCRRLKLQESKEESWCDSLSSSLPAHEPIVDSLDLDTKSVSSATPQSSPAISRQRHDTFPSVQLDEETKEKLLKSSWNIPLFEPFHLKLATLATLAQDGDFHYVQRVVEADCDSIVRELGFIKVLNTDGARFKPKTVPVSKPRYTGAVLLLDKGCTTNDLLVTTLAEGIEFLQGCFPDVSEEELAELLQHCDEDVQWAMDLLLESTFQGELLTFPAIDKSYDVLDVPSLISKCHMCLYSSGNTMDQSIAERLADNSVARVKFIQEFHNRRTSDTAVVSSREAESLDSKPVGDIVCPDDIVIKLDSHVVQQLTQMFGQPENTPDTNSWARLDRETAKMLYQCLTKTAHEKSVLDQINEDEELARRLQADEQTAGTADAKPRVSKVSSLSESFPPLPGHHKHGKSSQQSSQQFSLATTIKRQQLQQMFPDIENDTLEDIFRDCGYNYEAALKCLMPATSLHLSVDHSVKDSVESQNVQNSTSPTSTVSCPSTISSVSSELSLYQELRFQCYHKAQSAHQRGMKGVATFYSQQAQLHTTKLKVLSQKAEDVLFEAKKKECKNSNNLDLHGLHVSEAVDLVHKMIYYRKSVILNNTGGSHKFLTIITGTGKRSSGGVPRIKPAVERYLNNNNISYSQTQNGIFKVNVMKTPPLTEEKG